MATRPVFMASDKWPFYKTVYVSFDWNSGFAVSQKQKNITAIHERFILSYPESSVLEISSKSMQAHGKDLSAFFLKKYVPHLGKSVPVECVFQAGKVFKGGGPYTDILEKTPKEAKRDDRLKTSGTLAAFKFEDKEFPLSPKTLFYDYLYINALLENPELIDVVMQYDAFTDIEFNPDRSINCQAKAAATFVSLQRLGLLDKVKDPEQFRELMLYKTTAKEKEEKPLPELKVGMTFEHKVWGTCTITALSGAIATVTSNSVGEKRVGVEWIQKNCF